MNIKKIITEVKQFPSAFWLVLFGTFLYQAGNMAFVFLVPYITQHLKFSLAKGALAFSVFGLGTLVSGIIGGPFIDRFGAARMMMGALLMNSITLFIFSCVHHYSLMIIMCLIWGIGLSAFRSSTKTLISFLSPVELHRISFSLYRWALNLGMSIGPALGGLIVSYSFSALFAINAMMNLIACLFFILGLMRTPWLKYRPSGARKIEFNFNILKQDINFRIVLIGILLVEIVFIRHESLMPIFLTEQLKFSLSFYGLLFTLNTLIIVFCELPLNIATLHWSPRLNLLLGCSLVTIGFAGLAIATSQWQVMLCTVFWTFGEMIMFPAATAYVSQLAPENKRGSYFSLFDAMTNIALSFSPWLATLVGLKNLWVACGVFGVVALLIFHRL